MRIRLEENNGIPASLLWMLAIISGVAVANLYYNQPLLNRMGEDLHVSEFTANLIPMVTQIGYALGLLFIIPLGDLYKRRNIIVINFSLLACSMLAVAVAPDIRCILAASLVTGVCSVMPQIFIPMVSQFSLPQNKARNVGMLVSGLLAGILGSRVISGIVGEYWGWRTMYYIAALMMLVCIFVVLRILPDMPSNFRGTYRGLMKSLLDLFRSQPTIRMFRTLFRQFPGALGLSGLQTERTSLLCRQQRDRYAGTLRSGRGTDCFLCGSLRPPAGSPSPEFHRLRTDDCGMGRDVYLSGYVYRIHCRYHPH